MHSSVIYQPSSDKYSMVKRSPFAVMVHCRLLRHGLLETALLSVLCPTYVGTTFEQSVTKRKERAMSDICILIGTNLPSSFVLSHAGNGEWVLVH